MRQLSILILLFVSIVLPAQNKQKTSSTPRTVELSEVTVVYENMYDIYKRAARNLKKKLIRNHVITYRAEGKDSEDITGEERSLVVLFTAKLEKASTYRKKLFYRLRLSNLDHSPDVLESIVLKRSRYCAPLFSDNIANDIKQSDLNTMESNDSLIYICDKSNQLKETILLYYSQK